MEPSQIAFDFIEHCRADSRADTVLAKVASCAKDFGFPHFILAGLPFQHERFERFVLLNHWPREWYERFVQSSYFPLDGVGQWAMRTSKPFTYGEVPDALRFPDPARKVRAEAAAFGLADGFVVPMLLAGSRHAALSFSCPTRCDLRPQHRVALHLIAVYAGACIHDADKSATPHSCAAGCGRLSAREREVLAWAAAGKSAWETSVILSVSERTVTKHLEHVRAKLNVATTAQAVAEGLRCGEIVV